MLTSLPLDFKAALGQARALGFASVDVVALAERPAADLDALADTGLLVACASVGRGLPAEHTLDAAGTDIRRAALEAMYRQIADAARLGATCCYVVPGKDSSPEGLIRFAEACRLLADFAGQRMIRLCVEHCPGRALSTVAATLEWLRAVGHENLRLLLDVGHCLISQEEPAAAIRQAGAGLGYVHLDDNDGVGDLHWPLMTGRLTAPALKAALHAIRAVGYDGALALELNPTNPDPVEALRQGRRIVERLTADEAEGEHGA
jgi:hydroxypyruvate isomerase